MSATVYKSQPSVPVQIRAGRGILRIFDFEDRETKQKVHLERRALQGTFVDSEGCDTICVAVPERDWSLDLSQLERKQVVLFATNFQMDRQGVCVIRFCGFDFVAPEGSARELKR